MSCVPQVLWIVPVLIMAGTVAVVTFHLAYDLCLAHDYEASFFHRAVPGAMDSRLSRVAAAAFHPRCVWLLSRHCWHNARLLANAGLSKALARQYRYASRQHRQHPWRDQHFPTLRADQVRSQVRNYWPRIQPSVFELRWNWPRNEPSG